MLNFFKGSQLEPASETLEKLFIHIGASPCSKKQYPGISSSLYSSEELKEFLVFFCWTDWVLHNCNPSRSEIYLQLIECADQSFPFGCQHDLIVLGGNGSGRSFPRKCDNQDRQRTRSWICNSGLAVASLPEPSRWKTLLHSACLKLKIVVI